MRILTELLLKAMYDNVYFFILADFFIVEMSTREFFLYTNTLSAFERISAQICVNFAYPQSNLKR